MGRRKNVEATLISDTLKVPFPTTVDLSLQYLKHATVASDSNDVLLCSGMDAASTGTQKDSRGSAFRGRRGSHAKVDKTWLLQTKYIMNDLYSTDVTESKLYNVDRSQSIGCVQNSSISKEFSFLSKCEKKMLQHPSKKNIVVASSCVFLPNSKKNSSFHELQFLNYIKSNKMALLRSDETVGHSLVLKVALQSTTNEDFYYADRAKISKKGKD